MTIDDQIKDEKLQYDIDKHEYLTGEEILPSITKQIIDQAKFTYSALGKAFKEQTKEQVKLIKNLSMSDKTNELKQIEGIFPQNVLNDLISNKLEKIIELQNSTELDKLNYKNYDLIKSHCLLYFQEIYT